MPARDFPPTADNAMPGNTGHAGPYGYAAQAPSGFTGGPSHQGTVPGAYPMRDGFQGGGSFPGPGAYPAAGAFAGPGDYSAGGVYPAGPDAYPAADASPGPDGFRPPGAYLGHDGPAGWHSAPPPLHHETPHGPGAPGSPWRNPYPGHAGYGDPRYASPQFNGPQHAGPQYPGPQYPGPPYTGTQYAGPQHFGPPGYGEYAEVIREDAAAAPRPTPPDGPPAETLAITVGLPLGVNLGTPASTSSGSATATVASTPAGAGSGSADPGDGDGGYGPPGAEWYRQTTDATEVTTAPAARTAPETTAASSVRTPFEPLKRSDQEPRPSHGQHVADGPWAPQPGMPDYATQGYEGPDEFELDLSGLEGDSLGQLHGLYDVAGSIPGGGSDEQFHQLLERQRKLISDYFKESGSHAPVVPPPGPAAGESLPGTLGERLRGR